MADQFRATERPAVFLVTHLLADRPAFVRAVGSMGELRSVLPKPESVDAGARLEVGDFLHGAAVGPFIFLVQGEILAALGKLASGRLESGMQELGAADRAAIAAAWLDYWNR
ncbi:MAG TPA: hypothetical protein VGG25_27045 [Streptosporangiaceae bacterium]